MKVQLEMKLKLMDSHTVLSPNLIGFNDVIIINPSNSLSYNITVQCPAGYQTSNLTEKCIQLAGNEYRTDDEKRDDNNTIDNDG